MKLIVGLGNSGKEYENMRHNLGFIIIDQLASKLKVKLNKKRFNGLYYRNSEYILLKPQTYMNNSGECITTFMNHFRIPVDNLLVIYDEIALPVGKFRYRSHGSAGGHNGIKNIIQLLGTQEFKRLRVGIGYDRNFLIKDWVLENFSSSANQGIKKITPILLAGLLEWIKEGNFEKVMSKFNSGKETNSES